MNAPDPIAALRRGDVALRWVPLAGTDLEVMTDALRVEGVRAPLSARTAQRIADLLTAQDPEGHAISLPTPAVVDLCFAQTRLPIDTVRGRTARPVSGDLAIYTRGSPGSGLGHVDRVVATDATGALTAGANEEGGRWVIERVEYGDARLEGFVRG